MTKHVTFETATETGASRLVDIGRRLPRGPTASRLFHKKQKNVSAVRWNYVRSGMSAGKWPR